MTWCNPLRLNVLDESCGWWIRESRHPLQPRLNTNNRIDKLR